MNIHDMTEVAYKNGYEAGLKEAKAEIEELKADKIIAERHEKDARELYKEVVLQLKKAKFKAIKEFAEKFKSLFEQYGDYDTLHIYEIKDRIDIIEEVMTEQRKDDEG